MVWTIPYLLYGSIHTLPYNAPRYGMVPGCLLLTVSCTASSQLALSPTPVIIHSKVKHITETTTMHRLLLLSPLLLTLITAQSTERSIVIMNQSGRRVEVHWVRELRCTLFFVVFFWGGHAAWSIRERENERERE